MCRHMHYTYNRYVTSLSPAVQQLVTSLHTYTFIHTSPHSLHTHIRAGYIDPLAAMMLSSEHFRVIGQKLNAVAQEVCGGKIVYAHEVCRNGDGGLGGIGDGLCVCACV